MENGNKVRMRLKIKYTEDGKYQYTPVSDEFEALSLLNDARCASDEEIMNGIYYRPIAEYDLVVEALFEWIHWHGDDGETFEEFCAEMEADAAMEHNEEYEPETLDALELDEDYPEWGGLQ